MVRLVCCSWVAVPQDREVHIRVGRFGCNVIGGCPIKRGSSSFLVDHWGDPLVRGRRFCNRVKICFGSCRDCWFLSRFRRIRRIRPWSFWFFSNYRNKRQHRIKFYVPFFSFLPLSILVFVLDFIVGIVLQVWSVALLELFIAPFLQFPSWTV